MSNKIVQVGDRFGKLVVQEKIGKKSVCLCDCGEICERDTWSLSKFSNLMVEKSCGCARKGISPSSVEKMIEAGKQTRFKSGEPSKRKKQIDRDKLVFMYHDLDMTANEISKELCLSRTTVLHYIDLYCIERRNEKKDRHIRRGEDHHSWKGGISSLSQRIRTSIKYYEWRVACFRRDNYRCVDCGSRNDICVHHIKHFSKILLNNDIHTIDSAMTCEELWDINNGETLCGIHHKDRHKRHE
jgi:hypothetical protein